MKAKSTPLQILQRKVSWFTRYRLHDVPILALSDLGCSPETFEIAKQRNELTHKLQVAIKADYERQKEAIRKSQIPTL